MHFERHKKGNIILQTYISTFILVRLKRQMRIIGVTLTDLNCLTLKSLMPTIMEMSIQTSFLHLLIP